MTDLIFSGSWVGKRGILRAEVGDIRQLNSIEEISTSKNPIFLVVSYDLSRSTTGIKIKESGYPKLITVEIRGISSLRFTPKPYEIHYKGAVISDINYKSAITSIKENISKGIVYQVNLTNRFDFDIDKDIPSLAIDFFKRQPVPYFFYLRHEDFILMSGSMELFLHKRGNLLSSMPIKGTSLDRKTLMASHKDRAENLMITDMMRNDIGRVSDTGSVSVTELFRITRYRTLYQMHSKVVGISKLDITKILLGTFPPASVTGAPKIKAVEVIDGLEPHARGYYCGCAGFLMPEGDFTLSVLIRTAYGMGKGLSYFAGCGIVWDSDLDKELNEMYLKVRAFYPLSPNIGY
ncbi:MAG: anthranilate synthase component I family protein [Thermodesulfovibrionales bacterium]